MVLALAECGVKGLDVSRASQADQVGRCRLGSVGPGVSCIAYGTIHLHEAGSAQVALEAIERAVDAGITTFDLSDVYNSQPELFGAALQLRPGLRERIEVIAKMNIVSRGWGFDSDSAYDTSPEHLDDVLEKYLTVMNSTYVDVLMFHRQDYLMDVDEVQEAFLRWKDSGKVRYMGVSNFDRSSFELLNSRVPLVANEIEVSPLNPKALYDGTVAFHYSTNTTVLAWGPLGGDPWGGPNRLFKVVSVDGTHHNARIKTALGRVGAELGVEQDVVAVAWLLRHPAQIVPIIGTMNPERLVRQAAARTVARNMTRAQWYLIADGAGMPLN